MRQLVRLVSIVVMALGASSIAQAADMTIKSESFASGKIAINQIFNGFGCDGKNLSPQLSWDGVPKEAKSLALTIYDPDAPTGSGWWHWVAFNMPTNAKTLAEGASGKDMPVGTIESMTDYGKPGFGGACPPMGDKPHRYIVTLWALDKESLPLDAKASAAMVGFYLNQSKIATAKVQAEYSR